jgi:predicted AlkP superfamily phosphohydrolase/phosphomutase
MITGMLSPDLKSACYPEDLYKVIANEVPDYSVEAIPLLDKVEYVHNIRRSIEARTDLSLYLMREYSTDVFVMVFTELDRLQHFFWSDMDSIHPMHSESLPEIEQAIDAGYIALDNAVSRLLEAVGEETIVLILSDHGFESVFKMFYVNSWLEEHGYLRLKNRQTGSLLASVKKRLQRIGLWKAVRQLGSKVVQMPGLRSGNLSYSMAIDWQHTKAAFGPNLGININVHRREPQGIVSAHEEYESLCYRLQEELESYRDPETGEPVVERVLRREEVYTGEMVEYAPDLRLIMAKSHHYPGQYAYSPKIDPSQVLDYPDKVYGNHAKYGIFIISGRGIRSGLGLQKAEIIDVAPTILRIMGLVVPENMDGRPLSEVFDETGIEQFCSEKQPVDYASAGAFASQSLPDESTDRQEMQVIKRLRDLGYLD